MTWAEFETQMNRLTETFGKAAYSKERVGLIWREVQSYSRAWMERTIDDMIGSHRTAPLLPEFREATARERERLWSAEKKQHESDANAFWNGTYHPDEVKAVCQVIKDRMRGGVPDDSWNSFLKVLRGARGGSA